MNARPPLEDLIDFVITGPDGTGAGGRSTRVVVREMFQNARESVVVIGYAVHQGQRVFQTLADRMAELTTLGAFLEVSMACRKPSAPGFLLLDACQVFVSSGNFTEAAQQRNIEVGVLLRSPTVADRLLRFLDTLVERAQLRRVL